MILGNWKVVPSVLRMYQAFPVPHHFLYECSLNKITGYQCSRSIILMLLVYNRL